MTLFSSLNSSAQALSALDQALNVSQNNVSNASTPGYANEVQSLDALPFDPANGLTGGVEAGEVQSSRDQLAEQNVRTQTSQLGTFEQQVSSLTALQGQFDISGNSGIPAAFNELFSAFSSWSTSPGDADVRQNVIQSAEDVASAFQETAANVSSIAADTDSQLQSLTSQVNTFASQIQTDNAKTLAGDRNDGGVDADLNNALQNLSEIANITTLREPDGTTTVLLGGEYTLVAGAQQNVISAKLEIPQTPAPVNPSAPPDARILDSQGNDITAAITAGKLGGILNIRNQILPAIQGDGAQTGALNQLAQAFASRVNSLLTSGNISDGPPAQTGTPLFTFDSANSTNVAASLSLDSATGATELAAIDPGPPEVTNGIALKLADLATPTDPASELNGQSYTQFFGSIAANVGSALSDATTGQTVQTSVVAQATAIRQQSSGVNLDEEAVSVLELQRSYQAASKMLSVVDEMTQSIISLIT